MAVYSSPHRAPLRSLQFYPSSVSSQILLDATVVTSRGNSVTTSTRPLPAIPEPSTQLTRARLVAELPPPPPPPPPTHPFPTQSRPVQHAPRPLSTFMPPTGSPSFISTLQEPYVLAPFIAYLDWVDLYSLLTVNRTFRNLFTVTRLRDVVLSRYVPGYTHSLRARDMKHYQDVQVSVRDLDLLLVSQRLPLHRYPMHALRTMTALCQPEDDEMTSKLVALTQAHSRFVLILQSLVHSSSRPIPLEPEEAKASSRVPLTQTLRKLTFPAPLAYPQPPPLFPGTTALVNNNKRPRHQYARSPSINYPKTDLGRATLRKSAPNSPINSQPSRQPSIRGRRLSFFGQQNYLTPPPPEEPRALKIYSNSWRNSWRRSAHPSESTDENGFVVPKVPSRRFATVNTSSDSSIDVCPSRSSVAAACDSPYSPLRMASPHDLNLATSRMRAPVLRVFVPCSRLEDGDDSLIRCEKQLLDSGIWDHLSTGDIVCNFGYVPDNPGDGSSDGDDITPLAGENHIMMRSRSYRSRPSTSGSNNSSNARKWLLFNGQYLVPYTPPDLLPLDQPLSLPSPFYYLHIMPPFTNLTYTISQLPVCDNHPQLTLVHSTTKVPSPHSPKGYALVKKYAWTARVVRLRTGHEGDVGDGWFGEWILEGEGTREGMETLLNALKGQFLGMRVWELVREKSGGGKLWLKLLPS